MPRTDEAERLKAEKLARMEKARELTAQGMSARLMGEALGVSLRVAYRYRAEMGLHTGRKRKPFNYYKMTEDRILRVQGLIDEGQTWKRIRAEERISYETLNKYYSGRRWFKDQNGILQTETK